MNATLRKCLQSDTFIGCALALVAFAVYWSTLLPGIGPYDCGELGTVAATLGIAHPSGYPLFTLVGWVFAHLPLGHRIIWNLNLLSAIFCAAAVLFFYRLFLFLLSEKVRTQSSVHFSSQSNRWAAAIATLVFAFSTTYWSQATSIEVYALHVLFLSLVLFLFLHSLRKIKSNPGVTDRSWYLFAFVLGLSFTNHMTTVLLAPGFLYLFFATIGFGREAWIKVGQAVPPFIIGLTLYLYLPFRAAQHPLMNWGDPVTFEKFFRHVTTQQYRYLMFSSWDVLKGQSQHFFSGFFPEFGYAPLLFAPVGMMRLFRESRRFLVFTLLLFFGCLLYSLNYYFYDTNSFFLLAYVAVVIWILFGIRSFLAWPKSVRGVRIAQTLCGLMILFPLAGHYHAMDESHDYAIDDYVKNMLGSLDSNAVIFSQEDEYFASPFDYLQQVERVRPDVASLDCVLLADPWYFSELERQYPWLVQNSRSEIDAFLQENSRLLRHDAAFDSANLIRSYTEMVHSMIEKSYATHPVYISSDIKVEYISGFGAIPSGLVFKLFRGTRPVSVPLKEFSFRPFSESQPHIEKIKSRYAAGYVYQGIYGALAMGDTMKSVAFLRKSLEVKPDYQDAAVWLQRLHRSPVRPD